MARSRSKLTSQGQISVPVEIRRELGVGSESILKWEEEADRIFVRLEGKFSSEEIHRVAFSGNPPEPQTLDQLKQGIRLQIRERQAHR